MSQDLESYEEMIEEARSEIDKINDKIVRLLALRSDTVDIISEAKSEVGGGARDKTREEEMIRSVIDAAKSKGANPRMVQEVFRTILKHSVARQRSEENDQKRDGQ